MARSMDIDLNSFTDPMVDQLFWYTRLTIPPVVRPDFLRRSSIKDMFIQPKEWVRMLDEENPNKIFTRTNYNDAWAITVDKWFRDWEEFIVGLTRGFYSSTNPGRERQAIRQAIDDIIFWVRVVLSC